MIFFFFFFSTSNLDGLTKVARQIFYIYLRDLGAFSDKRTSDIDGFTREPVVGCDLQVVENTFLDDSK